MTSTALVDSSFSPRQSVKTLLVKWTPRVVVVCLGSYYGLGIAYEMGLMALIDRVAIQTIKYFAGYVGIGALMPTVQWHAAWVARVTIGLAIGLVYDVAEKALSYLKKEPCAPNCAQGI